MMASPEVLRLIGAVKSVVPPAFWDMTVDRIRLADRDRLAHWGMVRIFGNDRAGREALRLSNGCFNLANTWVSLDDATRCFSMNDGAPLFIDAGNAVYKQFLTKMFPGAAFHRYITNEENAGDILESALGIVVMTWSLKGRERVNRTAYHIYNMMCKILIAAFVDFQLLGRCDF